MKTITADQKSQLSALREKVRNLQAEEYVLLAEAEKIVGESEYLWDYLLNDMYDTGELLDRLGIDVNGN